MIFPAARCRWIIKWCFRNSLLVVLPLMKRITYITQPGISFPYRNSLLLTMLAFLLSFLSVNAQDSSVTINKKVVTLKEVVVRSNLNVPTFIERVKNDTSFYKAFKNLKVLGYTSLNDIRIMDKKGR